MFGSDVAWIQKNQEQLQRFATTSFLEAMLSHLRKVDVLSPAEETKIREADGLRDQINMLSTVVTNNDSPGHSAALQNFVEGSDSQVAQLIIHHGERTETKTTDVNTTIAYFHTFHMPLPLLQIPW